MTTKEFVEKMTKDEELENAAGGVLYGPYGIGETLRTIAILTGKYDPFS